jgi:hypothetical protein
VTDLSDPTLRAAGAHLDDEVISALIDDELPVGDRAVAAGHRSACARCRRRSDELGRAAMAIAVAPTGSLEGERSLAVAAALAAALVPAPPPGDRPACDPVSGRPVAAPATGRPEAGRWASSTGRGVPARPGRRRLRRARVMVGAVVVAAAGLAAGGLHGSPAPAGATRSVVLASSLGSFSTSTSLRATLEATVASIDATGPAGVPGGTGSVPCYRQAARAAELAAATAAVPPSSGAGGPEATFAAPVELTDVPAEVFTFPRLSVAGPDGTVTRLGTYAVVVEDGTCAVVARLGW